MLYAFLNSQKIGTKMCTFLAKQLELQQFKGIKVSDSDLVRGVATRLYLYLFCFCFVKKATISL